LVDNYHSATFRNLAAWTPLRRRRLGLSIKAHSSMGFDSANSVLYTSNSSAGAWRMVVKQ
jgi:hypothetical protein